jgi:serine/threonine protein phosphatase PrpC
VTLRVGSATDTGRVRDLNEDSLLVTERLFAVADGMGGHAAGEVASLIAVETLKATADATPESIVEAVRAANRAVRSRSEEDPDTRGMGTTLSVVGLVPGEGGGREEIVVANVGDSRVYRLHQGELEQVSEDHSLVQDLVREGRLTAAEARVHPNRNVVTRTIGIDANVDVDWWIIDPAAGDRYLVCSDGLTDEVEDHAIARVLHTVKDTDEAARQLVDLANAAGGRDNITVLVVDVVDDGGRAEAASAALGADPPRTARNDTVVRESSRAGTSSATAAEEPAYRPKRFTWRVALFVLAVVLVLVGAFGGTIWFARNTYSVALADEEITIFRGRELLWFEPTIEERTDLGIGDIQPSRRAEVEAGHEVSSRAEADRYLRNITTTTTTSTTTTTTTTTTITPPAPTTTAAPPPP